MALEDNLRLANEAIEYVHGLEIRSATRGDFGPPKDKARQDAQERIERQIVKASSQDDYISRLIRKKIGNCGEMALLAANHLKGHGVYLAVLQSKTSGPREWHDWNHAFLVIGANRKLANTILTQSNPPDWGNEAVICDPWLRKDSWRKSRQFDGFAGVVLKDWKSYVKTFRKQTDHMHSQDMRSEFEVPYDFNEPV